MSAATVDDIHAKSEIKEVEISKLRSDYSYQRDPSETLVDSIANDWDTVASELVLVSDRGPRTNSDIEGGLWIVNGQHRTKAAQKKGMTKIWARVINLRNVDDPAKIEAGFRLKTNVRLSDRPLERFKAQLRAEDPESLAIVKVLKRFEAEINLSAAPEVGINCVSTIEQLYRLDNGSLLADTLELVRDVWVYVGGKHTNAALLKGIAWFIEKHAEETDRTRLVGKLKSIGLASLESRARTTGLSMGGSLWVNYYRAMVEIYNEQLREKNRLSWKLRGAGSMMARGGGGERTTKTA